MIVCRRRHRKWQEIDKIGFFLLKTTNCYKLRIPVLNTDMEIAFFLHSFTALCVITNGWRRKSVLDWTEVRNIGWSFDKYVNNEEMSPLIRVTGVINLIETIRGH